MELKFEGLSEMVKDLRDCGISGVNKPLDVMFVYDTATDTMVSGGLYFGDFERTINEEGGRYHYCHIVCKSTKEISEDLVREKFIA